MPILKKLIHYLSVSAEVRGTDATGIAYVRDGSIVTYKKPKPAHKVKLFFPRGTRERSSGTPGSRHRAARSGTATTTRSRDTAAQNRSPSPTTACCTTTGSFAGNSISHRHRSKPTATSLSSFWNRGSSWTRKTSKRMAELVEGSFVFTILRNDNTLFLVKGNNPLTVYTIFLHWDCTFTPAQRAFWIML